MKILIVNKFYYPRGGDCVVAMSLEQMLKAHGHEVAVLAMSYHENCDSAWMGYFPANVDFSQGGVAGKISALKRVFGFGDVRKRTEQLLRDFRPDVVHLHNVHSYLSPVVAQIAKRMNIPVVWTMHDYKLVCPSYSCRVGDNICDQCIGHSKISVLKTRCMKGSLAGSAIAWLEAMWWHKKKLQRATNAFVCPSAFMASQLAADGFDKAKLRVLPNFVDAEKVAKFTAERIAHERKPYFCYVGRLSAEKGVRTLLEAFAAMPQQRIKVAGTGPLDEELRKKFGDCANIEFLGRLNADEVAELLLNSWASVMPSECFENNPLGVIESLCAGTPVIGAKIGGIPELIDSQECGIAFESGSKEGLMQAVEQCAAQRWDNAKIAEQAQVRFSQEKHYQDLMTIYGEFSSAN